MPYHTCSAGLYFCWRNSNPYYLWYKLWCKILWKSCFSPGWEYSRGGNSILPYQIWTQSKSSWPKDTKEWEHWNSRKYRSISRCYSILTSSKRRSWLGFFFFFSLHDDLYQLFYIWFVEVGIPANLGFLANTKISYLFGGSVGQKKTNLHKNKKGRNKCISCYGNSYIHFADSNQWQHNLSCIQKTAFLQAKYRVFYQL